MNDTFETQVLSITLSQSVGQVWGTSIPLHSKVQKKSRWTIALWSPPPSLSSGRYSRNVTRAAADGTRLRGRPRNRKLVDVDRGPHPPHGGGLDGTSMCVWDSIPQSGGRLHVKVFYWMDATERRLCVILPETLAFELFSIALSQTLFQIISAQSW